MIKLHIEYFTNFNCSSLPLPCHSAILITPLIVCPATEVVHEQFQCMYACTWNGPIQSSSIYLVSH